MSSSPAYKIASCLRAMLACSGTFSYPGCKYDEKGEQKGQGQKTMSSVDSQFISLKSDKL